MPDQTMSFYGALTREQKERFLVEALSQLPLESFEGVLLQQRTLLPAMSNNGKVQLAFRMGISPVAHAYRQGGSGSLNWELPQVPEHLRPLIYETSRLIFECQSALAALVQGRGDFTRALTLLNPAAIQEMADRFRAELQNYSTQLREASGRMRRPAAPPPNRRRGAEPTPPAEPAAPAAPAKAKKATPRSKPQAEPVTAPAQEETRPDPAVTSDLTESAPGQSQASEEAPAPAPEENASPSDAEASAEQSATSTSSSFGFDVLALAASSAASLKDGQAEE